MISVARYWAGRGGGLAQKDRGCCARDRRRAKKGERTWSACACRPTMMGLIHPARKSVRLATRSRAEDEQPRTRNGLGDLLYKNGLAEDGSTEDVADGSVGTLRETSQLRRQEKADGATDLPHLLEVELDNAGLILRGRRGEKSATMAGEWKLTGVMVAHCRRKKPSQLDCKIESFRAKSVLLLRLSLLSPRAPKPSPL